MLVTDWEGMDRERAARLTPIESARLGPDAQTRLAQAGNAAGDEAGYYDDNTGAYVPWFTLGVSLLGDGSVLR